jgi:hypothetical protein
MRRSPKLLEEASSSSITSRNNKTSIKAHRKPKKLFVKVDIPDIFSTAVMVHMVTDFMGMAVMDILMELMVMALDMLSDTVLLTDSAMLTMPTLQAS